MAVLVEGISVVVRVDAIDNTFRGGWDHFLTLVPNETLCHDGELARVGFMTPADVELFISKLQSYGLTFIDEGVAVDIAVVDQMQGATIPANWLQFARFKIDSPPLLVATCWLVMPAIDAEKSPQNLIIDLVTPDGWEYDNSLSANFNFMPNNYAAENLVFLRHENGNDIFHDQTTGNEVLISRA